MPLHNRSRISRLAVAVCHAVALPLALVSSGASAQAQGRGRYVEPAPIDFQEHAGWTQMFDGVSLKGWDGPTDLWHVENGNIVVQSIADPQTPPTYLFWKGGEPRE